MSWQYQKTIDRIKQVNHKQFSDIPDPFFLKFLIAVQILPKNNTIKFNTTSTLLSR